MQGKVALKDKFHFDEPGTLPTPGPIGRVVRLGFGCASLWLVWLLATRSDTRDLLNPSFWALAAFALMLAPYVVNIGFGVRWGGWPRVASVVILVGSAAAGLMTAGSLLSMPLWATVTGWMIYLYGHLGISFVLSAVLATPGCEMRALPHLRATVFASAAREHYCPGFIGTFDEWEQQRRSGADSPGDGESHADRRSSRDLMGNPAGKLLIYGVPFIALQLAGNLGGFSVATIIPAAAFLAVGGVCAINAWRSGRVHCHFMAPWCLLVGAAMTLYAMRLIDLGPDSWSLIVNTGLLGAALIYITVERKWGTYFGKD